MHLADAFIQNNLQCIQATHFSFFISMCVPWEYITKRKIILQQWATSENIKHRLQHKIYPQWCIFALCIAYCAVNSVKEQPARLMGWKLNLQERD